MKKNIITYILIFCALFSNAQLISTKPVDIPLGPLTFNPEFVKANKIKSISVSLVDKPDGEIIIDKGAMQGFEFDSSGHIARYYYTILSKTIKENIDVPAVVKRGRVIQSSYSKTVTHYFNDTIFCNIFYDAQKRIVGRRIRTGDYYDAYYYDYNESGNIKKELHCRETNLSENKKQFVLGVQSILSSETFEYVKQTETQIKKQYFNDEGREYKKAILNYDNSKNIVSENYDFIVSWMDKNCEYKYNTQSLLIEKKVTGNESGEVNHKTTYEYDDKNNLITERIYSNDILLNEITYLYDESKTLLKSHINRDHKNSSIGIVKYSYTFY